MRAQKRRHVLQRRLRVQAAHGAQHLQLVFDRQTVTRLGFYGRRPAAQKPLGVTLRRRDQLVFRRRARRTHARTNAAARLRDLLIRRAHRTLLEFIRARSGKHRMRMRVNKAGQHDPAIRVDHFKLIRDVRLNLAPRADPRDASIRADEHRPVFNERKLAHLRPHARARRSAERNEL
jgi:hypothetical protein